ncbi:MAG: hypothetical protein ABIH41_03350 [Nanoarchaeota archaeon]
MAGDEFLDQLFDRKILGVLRFFLDRPQEQFYISEVAKKTRLPIATVFRIMRRLRALEILDEYRMKKFKTYMLAANERVKFLDGLLATKRSALDEFLRLAAGVAGIQQIVLHGKQEASRASIIIVGQHIDSAAVQSAASEVKQQFGYNILHLVVGPEQFEQMLSMGLYPGTKVVLFDRK